MIPYLLWVFPTGNTQRECGRVIFELSKTRSSISGPRGSSDRCLCAEETQTYSRTYQGGCARWSLSTAVMRTIENRADCGVLPSDLIAKLFRPGHRERANLSCPISRHSRDVGFAAPVHRNPHLAARSLLFYAAAAGPNHVVNASMSPSSVESPTQATYPSGRTTTALGAVTTPNTGSSHAPVYFASTI